MTCVKQKDSTGCAIACVAMVTGKTYDEVKAAYGKPLEARGMTNREISDLLLKLGVANCDVIPFHGPIIRSVPSPMGSHWVVIDANGNKLDPA